ncbi:ribosome assembly RNA-binding protein YhbY [Leuconostoc carnosum]|uniref:Ribosome assembly RNA-binding protein YhbY n=1 Tax=Leuconostoc carnosum TaxID=1252 RepID=A0AAE6IM53_LEUCA|nr:ribosome assembly RNA-binding protein YhbY [Leuconostoc carnosum]QEA33841.1 ribosome assembly RNA-binding protein YhbY [Leuconostoc carnosum]
MLKITGKQKRFLRSKANTLTPIFSVGKNGLAQAWVDEVVLALSKRELVKISLQQSADESSTEVADFIQTHSDITVVQTIGRTLVLFLPAQEDKYKRISVELAKI